MVGLVGVLLTELTSGRNAWQQLGSGSLVSGVLLAAAVSAASVAPLLAGAVDADKLLPREDDAYADSRLPEVWTPTAEVVNGRAAMAGFLLLLVRELF